MKTAVLDASALLAMFFGEPGMEEEHGLGLADAFAAALAKSKKAELVTADTEFKRLEKELKINWLK
ncbi:MAG TPA: PIN domain-containing protein [Methylomirabilota bacterium]|nr:PIN domain-containing protein [Methylomirabilota bacterium]